MENETLLKIYDVLERIADKLNEIAENTEPEKIDEGIIDRQSKYR